jgi:hypothetical protein
MSDAKSLYDGDFFAWTKEQAEFLRSAASGGSNRKLDWENLAEEIESLGKSDRRELASRISVIIEHLVKLEHSPARSPRNKWRQTIRRERGEIERVLQDSPSLRTQVPRLITETIKRSLDLAIGDLELRRELTRAMRENIRSTAYLFSLTPDQVLGDWFPPEPQG